jgi:3-polyprenyl-4-hydroxybenzoate decarboxylase
VLWHELVAIGQGHLPGTVKGDAFQQGGAVMVDSNERVVYRFVSQNKTEVPDVNAMVEAGFRLLAKTQGSDAAKKGII